ncbi:MAG: hypothetical protein LBQ90_01320 [Synergistaceae bacterium]|nr:hypothetical protein [Synergistaceae bacterium]
MNYFGVNFPLDVCECGARGSFADKCPHCGSDNISRLRRVSGFLSEASKFAEGKAAELAARKPGRLEDVPKRDSRKKLSRRV